MVDSAVNTFGYWVIASRKVNVGLGMNRKGVRNKTAMIILKDILL